MIFIIVFLTGLQHLSTAQSPVTDTLQWLRTNIEQRQHLFVNKPLKVMFDSLSTLRQGILQYSPPYSEMWGRPDTIWSNDVTLYFGEPYGGHYFKYIQLIPVSIPMYR